MSRDIEKLSRLLKNIFSRREKHRYECNQACYTIKDPNNVLRSQKHLSIKKNVKHIDPKHTYTLNKSNQFYISKTSLDSLVSIHLHNYSLWWPNHIVPVHVSKVAKNIAYCVWKISQDCIGVYLLWRFEIWENHFNSHIIITVWWGISPSRYIL